MILILKTKTIMIAGVLIGILVIGGSLWCGYSESTVSISDYRIFVAGVGTVQGKWQGKAGIAIIGLQTMPAPTEGKELKYIDLLVANGSSGQMNFNPDITLVNTKGERYSLKAKDQPKVVINPGTMSQGTLIIDVPKGIPDNSWVLEVTGGPFPEKITLPLKVLKIKE